MTIQLQLPTEIEAELKSLSQGSKQGMQAYILEAIRQQLRFLNFKKIEQESALLQKINLGFSEEFWLRHNALVEKKQAEKIIPAELEELIEMTQKIENANAQRLEAAYQLAILRGRNPKDLMHEMGIFQPAHAQ